MALNTEIIIGPCFKIIITTNTNSHLHCFDIMIGMGNSIQRAINTAVEMSVCFLGGY